MLPAGPRSTYPVPPSPQLGARELARQILGSMQSRITAAMELKVGTVTTGCDGMANISPLNGTDCNGAAASSCDLVLYNPQNRVVVANRLGRALSGSVGSCAPNSLTGGVLSFKTTAPASCDKVVAALRKRRRFVDNSGNVYGPDGKLLGNGPLAAQLETDYIHRMTQGYWLDYSHDPTILSPVKGGYLEKTAGVTRSLRFVDVTAQSWPPLSPYDSGDNSPITTQGNLGASTPQVLEDCVFGGSYSYDPAGLAFYEVKIHATGTPDTFDWIAYTGLTYIGGGGISLGSGTAVPITGLDQALAYGITVRFGSTTGHSVNRTTVAGTHACRWIGSVRPNGEVIRYGVAVRGTLATANPCINGGYPNNNVLVTSEDDMGYSSNALIVRDPDSLVQLNAAIYTFGTSPEKFSFSTNDEGFFFAHCYTTPVNSRKVVVISVNGLTFAPTVVEVITLDPGSGFVTAYTAP